MSSPPAPVAPVAKKIPHRITQLDRTRTDDYAWMKDDDWQKVLRDPSLIKAEVKDHLIAENAYVAAMSRVGCLVHSGWSPASRILKVWGS